MNKHVAIVAAALAFAFLSCMARGDSAVDRIGDVRLKGRLGDTLDRMIAKHVMGTDVNYITAPFLEKTERHGWWQTEFWGKYMHSAVPYQRYCGSTRLSAAIDHGVDRILASQEPNGYIGNYPDELRCGEGWDVWGMKYTMMGLLHYYDGQLGKGERAARALKAACRVCDYLIAQIGPDGARGRALWETGNWSGYASSSVLEPVMWLYRRTQDTRYLDFATHIVQGMTEPEEGPRLVDLALKGVSVADRNGVGVTPAMKRSRRKAYEMMSCYQGLIEYYEVTGRKDLLDAAVATARDIVKEEINLAGGCACSEAWFHGARKQDVPHEHLQETCVTTTWMRFCEKLYEVTRDSAWLDQLERTFYNAYLGALKPDGSEFAGYTPLAGNRFHGQHHCFMHIDCCTANGPRGFLCFLKELFRMREDSAEINFYASALMRAARPSDGRPVAFDMYSLYPRQGYARIVSHTEGVGEMPLRLRIPAWCPKAEIILNGEVVSGMSQDGYFTVRHAWRFGDVIEIRFDMPVVAHTLPSSVAFTCGPVLLARDSRYRDGDMTERYRRGTYKDGQVVSGFTPVRSVSDDIWMTFAAVVPIGSHYENPEGALPGAVFFCDFASAGNTWRRDDCYRTWFPVERDVRE